MQFSIVIPIYNAEAYLGACIASVLGQSDGNLELVLVDDGSTDASPAICDDAAKQDARVRVLHQKNAGPIAARRAGILAARGEYTLFADADDLLLPDAIQTLADCIRETDADMILYNNVSRFATGDVKTPAVFPHGSVFSGVGKEQVYAVLISGWQLNNLWIKATKTEILQSDDTPYASYFDNPHADDLLMSLYPVTHAQKIIYLDRPLYVYRRIENSLSSRVLSGQIDRQFNAPVMDALRRYMTLWGMDGSDWLKRYYSRRLFGLVSLFWQHYRAADNATARRLVLDYPWRAHIPEEGMRYLDDNTLDRAKQLQLKAILGKNKAVIDAFDRIGRLRMRRGALKVCPAKQSGTEAGQ